MIKRILFASLFTCFCLFFTFSSENVNVQKLKSGNDVSFVNVFNTHSVNLMASKGGKNTDGTEKSTKKTSDAGFNSFIKKIAPYENIFFIVAIATTISFGVFLITGAILMGVGYSMRTTWGGDLDKLWNGWNIEYAGDAIFSLSWLFFLAAVATWVLWGLIQYGKKNKVVLSVFSTNDRIGLSIKL